MKRAKLCVMSLCVAFLSWGLLACGGPVSDSALLTGGKEKTWQMEKIVIEGKLQTMPKGFTELTRTYLVDGSWKDNLGSKGLWQIDPSRYTLREETSSLSPLVKGGKLTTQIVRIVSLKPKQMILEFDYLDLGTQNKGFGVIYFKPVSP